MAEVQTYGLKNSYTGSSSGILYTDRRDFYLKPNVVKELYGDVSPFVTFLMGLKTTKTGDPDYILFEHRGKWLNMGGFVRTSVDWSSGTWPAAKATASITLATASGGSTQVPYLVNGDVIEVRAGTTGSRANGAGASAVIQQDQVVARCRVSAISGAVVTLTAIDPSATDTGALTYDLAANDPFMIYSHASEEGSGAPDSWNDDIEKVWNSAQIIKTSVEITGTLYDMTKLRGYSNELARLRDEKMKEHKMKLNRTALLGVRALGTGAPTGHGTGTNSRLVRTTMGAIPLIQTYGTTDVNLFDRSWAAYDVDDFIDDMEAASQYDNAKLEKFAFAGSTVLAQLAKTGETSFFARSGGNISLSDWKTSSFGFDVRTLTHPFGQLHITWDPSLRYGRYKNSMVIIDPENVERVVFRPDQYQTALQDNDADLVKDQYFSDSGIGMTLVEKNSFFQFS
jgi:hypothetical protein